MLNQHFLPTSTILPFASRMGKFVGCQYAPPSPLRPRMSWGWQVITWVRPKRISFGSSTRLVAASEVLRRLSEGTCQNTPEDPKAAAPAPRSATSDRPPDGCCSCASLRSNPRFAIDEQMRIGRRNMGAALP
jgi:hypothetical protein